MTLLQKLLKSNYFNEKGGLVATLFFAENILTDGGFYSRRINGV